MIRRGRVVAALLLALAFGVGALSGMAAEEAFGIDWFEFLDPGREDDEDRLLAGLGLSEEQRERAEAILERREEELEDYWEARLPEIRRMLDSSYADVRSTLTPAQQARFDERVERLDGRIPAEVRD